MKELKEYLKVELDMTCTKVFDNMLTNNKNE